MSNVLWFLLTSVVPYSWTAAGEAWDVETIPKQNLLFLATLQYDSVG